MLYGIKETLCPLEVHYAEQLLPFVTNMSVTQFIARVVPLTLEEERKWIASVAKSDTDIVFAIRVDDTDVKEKIIGTVGPHHINWIDRTATFGIVIGDKEYWSGGYGTEITLMTLYWAFNSLNLLRIDSSAIGHNTRSIALHKKCGFVIEGRERKSIFKNGVYQDLVLFGLLKDEFIETIYSL